MDTKYINLAGILLAGGLLASCGGGSSSTTVSKAQLDPRVPITSVNQGAVVSTANNAAIQNMGGSSSLILNTAELALLKMEQQSAVAGSAGIPIKCKVSGTYSYDTDNTAKPGSNATYFNITYNNCIDVTGTTTDGTIKNTGVTHTTTPSNSITAEVDFINYTVTTKTNTIKINGGFNMSSTGIATNTRINTLKGKQLTLGVNTDNFVLEDFWFVDTYDNLATTPVPHNYRISYEVTTTNSTNHAKDFEFGFTTSQTISKLLANAYPHTGQFIVTGGKSTALLVTIVPGGTAGTSTGTLTIQLSTDNRVTWGKAVTTTWAKL